MKLYLAGKISDTTDYREKFFDASHELRLRGHAVINPVELNWERIRSGKPIDWSECMRADIAAMMTCEGICLLPDWSGSKGARLEQFIAAAVEIKVLHYADLIAGPQYGGLPAFPPSAGKGGETSVLR